MKGRRKEIFSGASAESSSTSAEAARGIPAAAARCAAGLHAIRSVSLHVIVQDLIYFRLELRKQLMLARLLTVAAKSPQKVSCVLPVVV